MVTQELKAKLDDAGPGLSSLCFLSSALTRNQRQFSHRAIGHYPHHRDASAPVHEDFLFIYIDMEGDMYLSVARRSKCVLVHHSPSRRLIDLPSVVAQSITVLAV
ncbi:hypothetical protein FOZ63_024542, partial [Perkinsus olseni]